MMPGDNERANTARYRQRQRQRGRCLFCRRTPPPGLVLCRTCLDKQGAYVKRRTQQRIKAGLCTRCGGKRKPRYLKMCESCRRRARKKNNP